MMNHQTLDKRFRDVLRWYRPAVRRPKKDTERVHQLRVASRRAVAALEFFAGTLPEKRTRKLVKVLKKVRRAAGDARDLDVMRQRLASVSGAWTGKQRRRVKRFLKRRRKAAQVPLWEIFAAWPAKRLRRRFRRVLDSLPGPECHAEPLVVDWRRQVDEALREFSTADCRSLEQLHRMRIQGKRLRYTLEILVDLGMNGRMRDVLKQLRRIQNQLGAINDGVAICRRLAAWRCKTGDWPLSADLNRWQKQEAIGLEERHRAFVDWWTAERREEFCASLQGLALVDGVPATCEHAQCDDWAQNRQSDSSQPTAPT